MRRIISITQVSLDGVMQAPGDAEEDPSNEFTLGGWAMTFFDEIGRKAVHEIIAREFDMLLGRRTYDIFASYWPDHADTPIGAAFDKATKYVATRGRGPLEWANSKRVGPDVVDEIRRLKASMGPTLQIWGSSELLQPLIAADLVDEYHVWVFPVVLGKGKRLFEDGVPPRRLSLVSTRSTPSGVLLNTYHSVGPVSNA